MKLTFKAMLCGFKNCFLGEVSHSGHLPILKLDFLNFVVEFLRSLCVLDTNPLSDEQGVNIFPFCRLAL